MKLTLPKGIRNALLACICAAAPVGTTLATGTLAGGAAFVAAFAPQAQAGVTVDEVTITTTEDTETVAGTAIEGSDGTYAASSNIAISATSATSAESIIISSTGTAESPTQITLTGYDADSTNSANHSYILDLGSGSNVSLSTAEGTTLVSEALYGIGGRTNATTNSITLTVGSGVTLNFTKDDSSGVNLSASTLTINEGGVVNTNVLYTCSGSAASTISVDGGVLNVAKGVEIGRDAAATISITNGGQMYLQSGMQIKNASSSFTMSGTASKLMVSSTLWSSNGTAILNLDSGTLGSLGDWNTAESITLSLGSANGTLIIDTTKYTADTSNGTTASLATTESSATVTLNGAVELAGAVTQQGGGTVIITGKGLTTAENTTEGTAWTVSAGTLKLAGTVDNLSGTINVSSGATFELASDFSTTDWTKGEADADGLILYTTGLSIANSGTFTDNAKGNWSILESGYLAMSSHDLSYAGTTAGDASALTWSNDESNSFGEGVSFADGDTVTFSGNTAATLGSDIYAAAVTVNSGASLALSSGTYSLSTNNFTLGGTLQIDSVTALDNVGTITTSGTDHKLVLNVNDADMTSSHQFDALRNHYSGEGSTLELSTGRYRLDATDKSWGNIVVNDGAQLALNTQSGEGYKGNITITGNGNGTTGDSYDKYGALKLFNNAKIASTSTVTVTKGGAYLVVWGTDAASVAGALVLNGDLTKVSGGTLNLSGGTTGAGALHIASGTVNISSSSLAHTGGTYLDGGSLGLAESYTLTSNITLSADSTIYGAASSKLSGSITSTGGNLSIVSSAQEEGDTGSHGASFSISGTVNLGSNNLIIKSGVVNIGTGSDNNSVLSFTAGTIDVQGGILKLGMGTSSTMDTDITLSGGRILVQATDSTDGDSSLNIGTLTVNGDEARINCWNSSNLTFEALAGSANLELGSSALTTTFTMLDDYTGTLNVASGTAYINSANISAENTTTVTGSTISSTNFVKTGEGSVSFANHTANAGFTVKEGTLAATTLNANGATSVTGGTLVVGSLALGDSASLSLTGGNFATSNTGGLTIDKAVTVGGVTFGTTDAANAITLSGTTTFTGTAINTVALSLTGGITVDRSSLRDMETVEGLTSYSYNGSGYKTATYYLVKNNGGSLSLGTNENSEAITTITATGGESISLSDNNATINTKDTSVYYVNSSMSYIDDKTDVTEGETTQTVYNMKAAESIHVANGSTLSFDKNDWGKELVLAGGTVKMSADNHAAPSGSLSGTIVLESTGDTLTTNTIQASWSTLTAGVSGVGNLVVERNSSKSFFTNTTYTHTGNLTLVGITVEGGKFNNTGALTLDDTSANYSYVGENVTGITVQNAGTLVITQDLTRDLTLVGGNVLLGGNTVGGTYTLSSGTNTITSDASNGSTLTANVTGTGDLVLNTSTFVEADVNRILSVTGAIGNTGSVTATLGKVTLKDGASLTNTTTLVVDGGILTIDSTAGDIASKNLTLSSGTLVLGKGLALTGGATDANGAAVDTLVLTGGTLAASTDVTLGYNATLDGVTFGDGTNTGTITLGTADTTTTFTGTVQNNAALTLNGNIVVSDLSKLTATESVTRETGANGYDYATYTLVSGGTVTLNTASLSVTGLASGHSASLAAGTTGAVLTTAETTYHVATGTVAHSAITAAGTEKGFTFSTISLEGGMLNADADVTQAVAVAKDSSISVASKATSTLSGGVTAATGTTLTLSGGGTIVNSSTAVLATLTLESGTSLTNTGSLTATTFNHNGNLNLQTNNSTVTVTNWVAGEGATITLGGGTDGTGYYTFASNASNFSSAKSYTGKVVIAGGRLEVHSDVSYGSVEVASGSTFSFHTNTTFAGDVSISGKGHETNKYGALTFDSSATLTGTVTVESAGAQMVIWSGRKASLNNIALSGDLDLNGRSGATGTLDVSGKVSGTGTLSVNCGTMNISSTETDAIGSGVVLNVASGGSLTTAGNLTIAGLESAKTSHTWTGNVSVNNGSGTLTISNATVRFGNTNASNTDTATNTLSAGTIKLQDGGKLDIYHKVDATNNASTNISLEGGMLYVQAMGGYETGGNGMVFGELSVTTASEIDYEWNGGLSFSKLTGAGNLTISAGQGKVGGKTTFSVVEDYTGQLTVEESTVYKTYLNDITQTGTNSGGVVAGDKTYSADGFVKDGSGSFTLADHTAEGSFEVKEGTLTVNALTANEGLTVSGGTLTLNGLTLGTDKTITVQNNGTLATDNFDLKAPITLNNGHLNIGSTKSIQGTVTLATSEEASSASNNTLFTEGTGAVSLVADVDGAGNLVVTGGYSSMNLFRELSFTGDLYLVSGKTGSNITLCHAQDGTTGTNGTVFTDWGANFTAAQVKNVGNVFIGNATISGQETSGATVALQDGAAIMNTGDVEIATGGSLTIENGGSIDHSSITTEGKGTVTISGGTLTMQGGSSVNTNALTLTDGKLLIGATSTTDDNENTTKTPASLTTGSLSLTGGVLASDADLTIAQDMTLGGVTIGGESGYTGAITLGRAADSSDAENPVAATTITLTGTIINNGDLTLAGNISIAEGALELSDIYSHGANGFKGGQGYYLVMEGVNAASDSTVSVTNTPTYTVGETTYSELTISGGSAYYAADDTTTLGSIYYVNEDMKYTDDSDMSSSTTTEIYVTNGQTLTMDAEFTSSAKLTLNGGTVSLNAHSLNAGTELMLASPKEGYSTSIISAQNSNLQAGVSGIGNLVLERPETATAAFNVNTTIAHTGNLTIRGNVNVQSGSISNKGNVTVESGELALSSDTKLDISEGAGVVEVQKDAKLTVAALASFSAKELLVSGGSVEAYSAITLNKVTVNGGEVYLSGLTGASAVAVAAGAAIELAKSATLQTDVLYLYGGATLVLNSASLAFTPTDASSTTTICLNYASSTMPSSDVDLTGATSSYTNADFTTIDVSELGLNADDVVGTTIFSNASLVDSLGGTDTTKTPEVLVQYADGTSAYHYLNVDGEAMTVSIGKAVPEPTTTALGLLALAGLAARRRRK